jgi:hypothetical protein
MAQPSVHSQHNGLEERDAFLHLILGLASVTLTLTKHLGDPGILESEAPSADEPLRGLLR